jgi:hypothetical protein
MSIRTRIFGPRADDPLLPVKNPKGAQPDTLNSIAIARTESRRGNARSGDRHRLKAETATLRHDGTDHQVELVNVSGGGAMVRTGLELHLWDHVGLVLGGESELDCAVRWIKGSDIGIEFAHETQIDCDKDARNELLRAVIRKSFPDIAEISFEYPKRRADDYPNIDSDSAQRRQADRHPLVWNGVIYYADRHDYEAEPVRLRNISIAGALVQSGNPLPEGATIYLDLRGAGRFAATVKWTSGDQSGLEFHELFDIHRLSDSRPEIAAAAGAGDQQPWAPNWRRSTVEQLAQSLGG